MLDFASLAAQIEKMLDEGRIRPDTLPLALEAAQSICARCDRHGDFNQLIDQAQSAERIPDRWHPARLLDSGLLCGTKASPDAPETYLVAASDGSQIYPDAHQIADCYLLHISGIALRYGAADALRTPQNLSNSTDSFRPIPDSPHMSTHATPNAPELDATTTDATTADAAATDSIEANAREVDTRNEAMRIAEAQENALMRATPFFGHGANADAWHQAARAGAGAANREMVDARRHVAELEELARLLESAPPDLPAVGLCDGIFDLRVSQQQPWRELAQQENHRALDALRQCGQPIGGFIASSRATDVVTALRVALREIARQNARAFDEEPEITKGLSPDDTASRGENGIQLQNDPHRNESRHQEPRTVEARNRETGDSNIRDDQTRRRQTREGEASQGSGQMGYDESRDDEFDSETRGNQSHSDGRGKMGLEQPRSRDDEMPSERSRNQELRGEELNEDDSYDLGALFNREVDEALSVLVDARLFDGLLRSGERSATFIADRGANRSGAYRSGANRERERHSSQAENDEGRGMSTSSSTHVRALGEGARHQTCFFYLKSGEGEVARVEFPVWVAQRADWLDRLHAVVLAQIERGAGYPIALMEAHEHAVVRSSERELFYQLLEEMMTARGLKPARSSKALSKSRPLV